MKQILEQLGSFFEDFFGGQETPEDTGPRTPLFDRRRWRDSVIPHECGHACVAWMSPAVIYVNGITFRHGGGGVTNAAFNKTRSDYHQEHLIYALGGLIGEMLIWKKVHTRGIGGTPTSDLSVALKAAERVIEQTTAERLEQQWQGRLAEPSFDVSSMYVRRPHYEVTAVLNLAYRRGKHLLMENRAGFDRLCRMAAGRRDLTRRDIESQFGPRLWVPGGI